MTIAATGVKIEADGLESNDSFALATDLDQFGATRQLNDLTIQSESGNALADTDYFQFQLQNTGGHQTNFKSPLIARVVDCKSSYMTQVKVFSIPSEQPRRRFH